ncbi:glycoside hydrolase family 2 [Millionella massiliensis]|uniref:glycoside hydrolase family 2 n=1 Tax=Millionella massiliensis TaxID=1871023 RepID=UPI0008DB0BC4|nr:glycoside hydrolase family 2 [Millionella massiliensis]
MTIFLLLIVAFALLHTPTARGQRLETLLSGSTKDWKVWLDQNAPWQEDTLYLPQEMNLERLPIHAPTCGWDSLYTRKGKACAVPTTVEQQFGTARDWTYHGVSWFWREFHLPDNWQGRKVLLQIEQFNQRIEVFVNNRLVGYDAVGMLPYQCDVTAALRYGATNTLAIRVTSPGGTRGWEDFKEVKWGNQRVLPTKDYSGIGGRVRLTGVSNPYIADIFVKNLLPALGNRIEIQTTVENDRPDDIPTDYRVSIIERSSGKTLFQHQYACVLQSGSNTLRRTITVPEAEVWSASNPAMYDCRIELGAPSGDARTQSFGFRVFEIRETDGKHDFYLNGQRLRLRSAIDWGVYAFNGLFPTPDAAERSIRGVRAVGHNSLNFHRRMGDTPLFENADTLGVYLYEEPGSFHSGGQLYNIDNDRFMRGQMFERLRRLVLRDRNHPSLLIYSLANEDLEWTPAREMGMRIIHRMDDSRLILNSSGGNNGQIYKNGQYHIPPYGDRIRTDYADHHTAQSTIQLMESDLCPTSEHNHHSVADSTILYWGEMRCYAGTFNYPLLDQQGAACGGYDRPIYQSQSRKLNDLFDRCRFGLEDDSPIRSVFDITRQAGKGQYYTNGRLGQVVMTNNHTDGYAQNGWSPGPDMPDEWASAILDQNRNLNAPAEEMAYWNRPLQVAILRQNGKYFDVGDTVAVRVCLVNEGILPAGDYEWSLRIEDGAGRVQLQTEPQTIHVAAGAVFAQTLADRYAFTTAAGWRSGYITITGQLQQHGKTVAEGVEQVLLRNRPSQGERFEGCRITVIDWPAATQALTDTGIATSQTLNNSTQRNDRARTLFLVGKSADRSTLEPILREVRNGADLILQTDSLMGEQLYRLGLLNQRIEVWGGTQTGHWNGNGSSYIECFAGQRAFATAHTISTRSWEAEGEPRGFYPFSSRHPLRLYGVYVANQFERNPLFPESKNVLVTYGEISYGRGRILLNSSYWVDEATVFSDLLFFNMLAHYGLENDDEQPGPVPSVPTNATTQEAKH